MRSSFCFPFCILLLTISLLGLANAEPEPTAFSFSESASSIEERDGVIRIPIEKPAFTPISSVNYSIYTTGTTASNEGDYRLLDSGTLSFNYRSVATHESKIQTKVLASDGAAGDNFGGNAVAMQGGTAVVASIYDDNYAGSAFVFKQVESGWIQQMKLVAVDRSAGDDFGSALALDGDTIVVAAFYDSNAPAGQTGSAYIFDRNAGGADNWGQVKKLLGSDSAANDRFGTSVAVDGDTVAVSAELDDIGANTNCGSVYVFDRNAGGANSWGQVQKIQAADAIADMGFGNGVALTSTTMAIAAATADTPAGADSGAVYIFERSGSAWIQTQKLMASDAAAGDVFGSRIAMRGETLLVCANGKDSAAGADTGATYVFVHTESGWVQQDKLTAGDAAASDRFGLFADFDGERVVVTANGHDEPLAGNCGAAYVFDCSNGQWRQIVKLVAADAAANDGMGAVAISGNNVLAGVRFDDNVKGTDAGAAYFFKIRQVFPVLHEEVKLLASDGVAGDQFGGNGVALQNGTAVVASIYDDNFAGSAFVLEQGESGWVQQKKLVADDRSANDQFGTAVALNGDIAVVGAWYDGTAAGQTGSAYVFERDAGGVDNWGQVKKLLGSDSAPSDRFGMSVAIHGDNVAVGTNCGSVYIFDRNTSGTGNWGQAQKIQPSDAVANMGFGHSIALSTTTMAIAAAAADTTAGLDSGAVYVFDRIDSLWIQTQKLTASDAAPGDMFGSKVVLRGNMLLIGAPGKDEAGADTGGVYVFTRTESSWVEQAKLSASDAVAGDSFGSSLDFDGERAVVGANGSDQATTTNCGAAYVFDCIGGRWRQTAKLAAEDAAASDRLGNMAISGNYVIAGVRYDANEKGTDAGAAYFFKVPDQAISVSIFDDLIDEYDETVQIILSNPMNASLGPLASHTITILDNDDPPVVDFTVDSAGTVESGGAASAIVKIEGNQTEKPISVDYAIMDGTTTAASDYTGTTGTVTINPPDRAKTLEIQVTDDSVDEYDETAQILLSNPVNAGLGSVTTHPLTILDDDDPPTVGFETDNVGVSENSGTISAVVKMVGNETEKTISVNYATVNGTAGAGSDYTAETGTLTFSPTDRSKTVQLQITDDSAKEGPETFALSLSDLLNATMGIDSLTFAIEDDESPTSTELWNMYE